MGYNVAVKWHKCILQISVGEITTINAYFSQGKIPESEYFHHKLDFIEELRLYLDRNFNPKKVISSFSEASMLPPEKLMYI